MCGVFKNPYRSRLHDFPGRIFTFDSIAEDLNQISKLSQQKKIFCELGSGSGEHLISQGKLNPEAVYFGFEVRLKRTVRTLEKANRAEVKNIFVLRKDAGEIDRIFSPHSISGIYINFPDPWQKPRQEKHRLLSERFLKLCYNQLAPGGFVSVKTDHPEYFHRFLHIVRDIGLFDISEETTDLYQSEFVRGNVASEFEKLFYYKGYPINYVKLTSRFFLEKRGVERKLQTKKELISISDQDFEENPKENSLQYVDEHNAPEMM